MQKPKLKTRDIVLAAMFSALLVVGKEVFAVLPNIEIVSFLIIMYTLHYPRLTPYVIYIFVGAECCLYGLNVWTYMYLYIWALLYLAVRLLRRFGSYFLWVIVSALFGLCYGILCAPVYLFIGGWKMAVSWVASGVIFDLLHCAGNTIVMLALYHPINKLFLRLGSGKESYA